jgi:hypothetical protein
MTTEQNQDDVILAYEPDLSLQKMLGDGQKFNDLLTPEIRQACQKLIDDARDSFFEEEKPSVETLRALVKSGNVQKLPKIAGIANEIRAQAKMFGFSFICNLSEQIVNFAQLPGKGADMKFMVLTRFVDALYIAMIQKMRDEGGELERELNLSVEYLKH